MEFSESDDFEDTSNLELLSDSIVEEKLSLVDENHLINLSKKWMNKMFIVISLVFCIIIVFLFLVIQIQNNRITEAIQHIEDVDRVIVRLTNTLSDSSLNKLFKQTYDTTIGEMKKSYASIHQQAKEDHNTFTSTYQLQSIEYSKVRKEFEEQKQFIKEVNSMLTSLTIKLKEYDSKVTSFSNRVLYDGTDRIDYAYEKNGGKVRKGNQWTSSPPSNTYFSPKIDPSIAINPPSEKGYCYPMESSTPRFSVEIVVPRNPVIFSIDHVSRFITDNRQTAPKYYEIWGFEDEFGEPEVLTKNCFYDIQGEQTQFCESEYHGNKVFKVFQLRIKENWGAGYTCLYRFRVH